ncbi:MAG: VanR-ABDEGLN family response regulator transcription factor [Lachnospiraceae bacterium]|nr:VanR-ABDEGLN family response regulator transcription factor [Lachnospiraceae bacterium]
MKEKILIVDDEKEIADLLELYLGNDGYEVYKFYNGSDAWDCLTQTPIDLALLDIMLPDMDGFALCRKIREQWYFPIIMLTARTEASDKIQGITMGADDYITKPFHPLEVIARVRAQLRRMQDYNSRLPRKQEQEIYDIHGLELNVDMHTCTLYGESVTLTPIEFSIVHYLCSKKGSVVSSEELFEQVWGEKYLDSNNTIMAHIAKIREKFHENSRKPKFLKTVWGVGYKIE